MAAGDRIPRSMVQRMKPEPASPDQRVPSQSNTAMRGAREWTAAWNSDVENISAVCAGVLVELMVPFGGAGRGATNAGPGGHPPPPYLRAQSIQNTRLSSGPRSGPDG